MDEEKDFVLDDRPIKFDPETFEIIKPSDPRYEQSPIFNFDTMEFEPI